MASPGGFLPSPICPAGGLEGRTAARCEGEKETRGQILRETPPMERKKFRFHVYITKSFSKRSGAVNNNDKVRTDLNLLPGLTAWPLLYIYWSIANHIGRCPHE